MTDKIDSSPESDRLARAAAIMRVAGERAKAEIDRATAEALAEILGEVAPLAPHDPSPPSPASTASAAWVADWINVKVAAELLGLSRDRAVAAIRRHGLGHVLDGRWKVDRNRVEAYLNGRPYPPLQSVGGENEAYRGIST